LAFKQLVDLGIRRCDPNRHHSAERNAASYPPALAGPLRGPFTSLTLDGFFFEIGGSRRFGTVERRVGANFLAQASDISQMPSSAYSARRGG
jgi:hypothetical protein